ncbi:CinA family protein LALA0_S03e07426g [Lachancea lanzarotensis]|uniref:LALA0S03e07426g1_1 n=1 Tax=Lachancea lanzarotensis TaxID=1245769 RepID=A0A0C7N115_9SACH|nr:uncharacterized protein LALA0_S03e07426g [Lachancea lanzarotensis]CEP61639.1 LALA0S03e07426g1_1 [Lachancea lanzarotensis]
MTAEFPPSEASRVVKRISEILIERDETLAVSEAACGGLISSYLVSIPGASEWFHGGIMVYSLKSRLKLSGWNEQEIHDYTGPSVDVALRLARNLKFELGATYTLSETGYASRSPMLKPAESEQAVGSVYYGVSGPNEDVSATYNTDSEDRCHNMQQFAIHGLKFLLKQLEKIGSFSEAEQVHEPKEPDSKKPKIDKT